jgi:putative peptidoglycan lipid II flippase
VTEKTSSASRQIARAAGTVMLAFMLSNLTGLVRQILVAQAFGTQAEIEAFNAANRVAETLFTLVAGGALASAFIPTFTTLLTQGDRKGAWRLASSIFNLILAIMAVILALAAIFAPQITRHILAPGFASDPAKEALTISLVRLMLPSAALFGVSGLVMGVLNAHQVFFVPALTPSMYQIGLIFGVLALSPRMGIYGLAWGVLIGAGLHLGLQIPALLRQRGSYSPTFGLESPAVREVARLLGPRLLGVAVVQLNFWVNTRLASLQPEGSVTAIVIAFALMLMPQAAIAQSVAIAAMPTFAAQYARGRLDEMRTSLADSLRGVLLLSIPASLGLMLLRKPLVVLLYQRGAFDDRSTELVAWALLWYAAGLVGHCLVEVLARAFYALHDTRTPVLVGAGAMTLNVAFSVLFSAAFTRLGWMPHGGLALANTLATALEAGGLIYFMRRRLGGLEGAYILKGSLQAAASALAMSAGLWLWLLQMETAPAWLIAVGGVAIGSGVYAVLTWLVGIREVRAGWVAVKRSILRNPLTPPPPTPPP